MSRSVFVGFVRAALDIISEDEDEGGCRKPSNFCCFCCSSCVSWVPLDYRVWFENSTLNRL